MSQDIFDRIRRSESIKAGFKEIAAETGYSKRYIETLYYKYKISKYGSKKDEMSSKKDFLIKKISENPDNLSQVFKETAKILNCHCRDLEYVYYKHIKKSIPIFNIISKNTGEYNVKNNINNKYKREKTTFSLLKNIWNRIKNTLKTT